MTDYSKYIELAFNPNSTLVQEYRDDAVKIRTNALKMADLPFSEKIINGQDKALNEQIVDYLISLNNPLWSLIVSNLTVLLEYQYILAQPIDLKGGDKDILIAAEKKDKILESCQKISERLKTYMDKFFDKDKDLHDEGAINIRPENMMRYLKKD